MARVLIVEDDPFLKDMYRDTLKSAGYDVETADDGEIGLNKINEGGWDVILIDIIIPKLNGLEVIEKSNDMMPKQPNSYIVFLTNLDKGEEIEKAKQLGSGYIIKSQVTPGELVEKVNSYLVRSQSVPE